MNRQQFWLIIGSAAMVLLLYFGFDTKPKTHRLIEKSRGADIEWQETENLLRKTKATLPEDLRKYLQGLDNVVQSAPNDSVRLEILQSLSGAWYDQQQYVIAGYYAERAAQIANSEDAWAIAGTTYGTELMRTEPSAHTHLAVAGAVRSFEHAISINPDNPDHRINLALCFAEHPPADQPMKGIMMLLDLNRAQPENISALFHLARLGMRTGQYDKAKERLETALSLDPAQRRLHCLMAELLRTTNTPGADQHQEICDGKEN